METIDRKGGSALWHQIGEILAADIAAGTFAPGEKLPTEPELMRRFGVSRFTVRQALGHLEQRGLVRAEQGRGGVWTPELAIYWAFNANYPPFSGV